MSILCYLVNNSQNSFIIRKMPSFKALGLFLATSLPFWQVSAAQEARNNVFNMKADALYGSFHKYDKRAASSSFSSSHYSPSFPASKTFTTPDYSISKSYSRSPEPTPASCGSEDCKFYNSKTKPYFIAEWPDVDFDTGEMYGGSTPVRRFASGKCEMRQGNANLMVLRGLDR